MRGMKKWLPFKSLKGQYQVLDRMKENRMKTTKPELSIDQIDDLNRALSSLQKGDKTIVTYFDDGNILKKDAVFLKSDGTTMNVFFKGFSLPFSSLISFEM
jgi:hypothetical protein